MLLDPTCIPTVVDRIKPGDFYRPAHETVASCIIDMWGRGVAPDPVTVMAELGRQGDLGRVGGAPYLHTLVSGVFTTANLPHYLTIVADHATRRALVQTGTRLVQAATQGSDIDDTRDRAQAELSATVQGLGTSTSSTVGEAWLELLEELEKPIDTTKHLNTGLVDLDAKLGRMRPGQFIVIGARPSVGKSLVGLTIARHTAIKCRVPTMFVSLEMAKPEVMTRVMAAEAQVSLDRLERHELNDEDWQQLAHRNTVLDAPLIIEDAPKVGLLQLRAKLRHHQQTAPIQLLVVDYLQLLDGPQMEKRHETVAELSRGLKRLAGEFGCAVIALAQLNRAAEARSDKRPSMGDLRESGSIEADADVVLLLHREEMHEKESTHAGQIDVIIAKQRQGPTGVVTLGYHGHYARVVDLAYWESVAKSGRRS
jgi:replicative DNA helicase